MNGHDHGRTVAALSHAVVAGGAAAGAYLLAKGEGPLWIGAAVFVVSRVAGAAINVLVRPRRRRRRELPGPQQLDGLKHDLYDRIGRIIDLTTWLQSEVEYVVSEIRRGVDDLNRKE